MEGVNAKITLHCAFANGKENGLHEIHHLDNVLKLE